MKQEIIYTEHYALIVSDEKIVEGSFIYETNIGEVSMVDKWYCEILEKGVKVEPFVKVIAHRPLEDVPILEGVPLLPEWNVCDEELLVPFPNSSQTGRLRDGSEIKTWMLGWEEGFKEAKETYKYTEEDIQKAFIAGEERIINKPNSSELDDFTNFIQSLQQAKRPKYFECEEEIYMHSVNGDVMKPKTIINSQGQIELIGKYGDNN
jgi:hypothetical protein